MSEENQFNDRKSDEIDLRKLFQSIVSGIGNIWMWFLGLIINLRRLTVKFKYLIITSIILGIGISTIKTQSSEPYYQGSLIIKSNYLNENVSNNLIDDLNKLNSDQLSEAFNLDTAITSKILGFSINPMVLEEEKIEFETIKQKLQTSNFDATYRAIVQEKINEQLQSYELIVRISENSSIQKVLGSLSNYCKNFDYIQKRINVNKQNLELKKLKLQKESASLDSLKSFIVKNIESMGDRSRQGSNNVILADDVNANPLNIYEQDLKLYDEELEINKELALQEDFQVFEGSYELTTPASPSFFDNLKIWLAYTLGAAYGIIFLIQINKYLNKVEKDQINN